MKKKIFIVFAISCLLISCRNDESMVKTVLPNTIELFHYQTGTMWVYEVLNTPEDSSEVPTFFDNDTIKVIGDSLIRGQVYKIIALKEFGNRNLQFYRDSSGCLINSSGKILFSMVNQGLIYNQTFFVIGNDTIYNFFDISDGASRNIQVPLGNFYAFSKIRFTNFPTLKETIQRISPSYYAPGIGLIWYEKFFLGSKRAKMTSKLIALRT